MLVLLGNTGRSYDRTRHNVGWMLEEPLLRAVSVPGADRTNVQQKFKALWWQGVIEGCRVTVIRPQTMMNLSGESVQAAARFFKLSPGQIVVAHDDVELRFGEVRLRFGGGLAGHNGLRSVAHCMATSDFWRLRIGIGRPQRGDLHGHVLGRFSADEETELPGVLERAVQLVRRGYAEGFTRACG